MNREMFDETKKCMALMCGKVEENFELAVDLIDKFNYENFQKVLETEAEINALHLEMDDQCYKLLALQQPMAKDLRYVMAWLRVNNDLERIGDQALNISQTAQITAAKDIQTVPELMNGMRELAKSSLRRSLDSLVTANTKGISQVFEDEQRINDFKRDIFVTILSRIKSGKMDAETGIEWILVSRNLERIGDHLTNIAENVIFIESGEDVRHPS